MLYLTIISPTEKFFDISGGSLVRPNPNPNPNPIQILDIESKSKLKYYMPNQNPNPNQIPTSHNISQSFGFVAFLSILNSHPEMQINSDDGENKEKKR
jgi:hypothetical protein